MRNLFKALFISLPIMLSSCGGDDTAKKEIKDPVSKTEKKESSKFGIGPIKEGDVTLAAEIDQTMAAEGSEIYVKMCTACHKPDKKFIGPAPTGIMERRTPEWIMNMILNPEQMVKEDAVAKALLMEFNGAPMANQNLTKEEARKVLEYFRTLK